MNPEKNSIKRKAKERSACVSVECVQGTRYNVKFVTDMNDPVWMIMDNHMNYKNDESLPFIEQLDQLFRMGCQKNQANIENAKMQQQVQHQRINHALPLSSSHFPPSSRPPSTIMPVYPAHNTASLMQNNLFMDFNASSLLIQSQDTAVVAVAAAQAIMSEPSMVPETDSDIAMPVISMAPPPPRLLPKRSTPSLHQIRNGSPVFAAAAGSVASPPHGGGIDLEEKDPSPESIPTQTISDPASNPSPHPLIVSKSEGDAMFPPSSLSSSSPGMTERDIMLIRRKLRNRASAKRSRIKREKEIQDLEINHQLREKEIHKLKQENMRLRVQNERLNIELMMFQRTRATGQPVAPSSNMNTNANMNMNMNMNMVPPPPDNPSGGFQ